MVVRADLLLTNARVWTGDPTRPWADSLAIHGNHLVAVGQEVSAAARLDLGGRLVIPGLWDAHIHFYLWSLGLSQVQLSGCGSLEDLLGRVRRFIADHPREAWIRGWGWNETGWTDPAMPTRHQLDALTGPDRPCLLYRSDMHSAVANTRALSLAGMLEPDLVVEGGVIDRDERGEPTGVLRELAISRMRDLLPDPSSSERERALLSGMERLHRLGVTSICDQRLKDHEDGRSALTAYARLHRSGQLALRVSCNVAAHHLSQLEELGLSCGIGDDRLQLAHVKIFTDGTLGSRTAWMLEPFLPGPFDDRDNCGLVLTPPEQIGQELRRALAIGFPVSIHAIGDRANRVCLDLLEQSRLSGVEPPAVPHRIEHAQTLADPDLGRLAQLGVTASLQPAHILDDMDTADAYLGERARLAYRFGGLARSRALLAFGSDAPVSDVNPFYGMHGALCRQRPDRMERGAWYGQERLSLQETLTAYTLGAATAAGRQRLTGSLVPGKRADLAVLDRDLFELERQGIVGSELADTRVLLTMVDGEVVHREL